MMSSQQIATSSLPFSPICGYVVSSPHFFSISSLPLNTPLKSHTQHKKYNQASRYLFFLVLLFSFSLSSFPPSRPHSLPFSTHLFLHSALGNGTVMPVDSLYILKGTNEWWRSAQLNFQSFLWYPFLSSRLFPYLSSLLPTMCPKIRYDTC